MGASEAADAGTWRLAQAPTDGVITLGEDGAEAIEVETYRPQSRARSPKEPGGVHGWKTGRREGN